ncbi:PQQ-binding-like beta-propeller repeat protein [Haloarcula marina]|uniref:PQQ-binding-like beta-propeller repeat protein n=1 Tax=Haloarcula marina TaxID=2961574 RepID=UPI0020B84EFC|nr:PQQ-binding-like beta-propeller repeat protein [Halomicroarcula marina]
MDRRAFLTATGLAVSTGGCLRLAEPDSGNESSAASETATDRVTTSQTATASDTSGQTETETEAERATLAELACSTDATLPVTATDAWGQPQSDAAATGYVPAESVGTDGACIAWRAENLGTVSSSIVLSDEFVFTGGANGEGLRASDRATGELGWTTRDTLPADELINVRNPLVVDGTVYVNAESIRTGAQVFALDAGTGEEQWRTKPAADADLLGALRYRDGTLYGSGWVGEDAVAWAVDAADGSRRWQTTLSGGGSTSLSVGSERVYVAGDRQGDAGVRALDPETGELLWRAVDQEVRGAPTVGDGTVYATTPNDVGPKTLFALDPASGETKWSFETLNGTNGSAVVADGTVTFGTSDGEIYCLDAEGAPLWRYRGEDVRFSQAGPIRVGDTLIAGATQEQSGLYAIDAATGDTLWSVPTPDVAMTPAVVDSVVYAMYRTEDYSHHLMALRA